MSKIGQKPITIPSGVTAVLDGRNLTVTGPKNEHIFKEIPSENQEIPNTMH